MRALSRLLLIPLLLLALPAAAATLELRVFLDTDSDSATGCTAVTADGPLDGVEQILITTLDSVALQVTAVERQVCSSGVFGPREAVSGGGWAVGSGNGVGGSDIIETAMSLNLLSPIVSAEAQVGYELVNLDSGGGDALPAAGTVSLFSAPSSIPALSPTQLLVLSLLLALAAAVVLRHRGATMGLLALALFGGVAGSHRSSAFDALDGLITSWPATPNATDPAGDPRPDIVAVFQTLFNGQLVFRCDAFLGAAPSITSPAAVSIEENLTDVLDVESSDPDGDTEGAGLSYGITGGADQALFAIDPNTGALTFNSAPDFEAPGDAGGDNVYDVDVTVTDSDGETDTQSIQVTVTDVVEGPTITSTDSVSVPENQTAVIDVQSDHPSESEGAGLTYSKTGGADQTLFNIDANTGVLSFITAPDFENPADADTNNVYLVEVTVTDTNPLTDVQLISVTVTDENEPPTITSLASASVSENQSGAIDVEATDPDGDTEGSGLSYGKTGGADQALFNLDANTGVLTFVSAPNREAPADADTNNVYLVQVTVTDSGGLTDVQDIAITVTDVNEGPSITTAADQDMAENQTLAVDVDSTDPEQSEGGGGLTYSKTGGADQLLFSVDFNSGALSFLSAPSFESPGDTGANNVYEVEVTVSDGFLSAARTFNITVTDVNEAPSASADSYDTVVGNTEFVAGGAVASSAAFHSVATNILSNDTDPDTSPAFNTLVATVVSNAATTKGGTVSIAADGGLTYIPPVGTKTTVGDPDTYSYQISDGLNAVNGTISFVVTDMVWYVQNNAPAGGDGTSPSPLQSLPPLATGGGSDALDGNGDFIYVFQGSGNTTAGIDLEVGQLLLGDGVDLVVGGKNLHTATGTRPTLITTAAATNAVTLESNNTVRGLNVGNTTGMAFKNSAMGTVGTLTINNAAVFGTGGAINIADGGSLAVTFDSLATTSHPPGAFVSLGTGVGVGGSLTVTNGAGVDTSASGVPNGIDIRNAPAGSSFSFGETSISSSGSGVNLASNNAGANTTFADLDITTSAGPGLVANNGGTVNLAGTGNTVGATGGPALDVISTSTGAGWTFSTLSSSGSATRGVNLDAVTGAVTGTGGSIGTAAGTAFRVNSGPGNVSYAGTITNTAGRSVEITNSGGTPANTLTFSGLVDDTGTGIFLDNNDQNSGATIAFSGGLDLNTGANTAFTATNGGTVNVTGTNTIGATTPLSATAVNIANTTIGAGGVTFQRVDVNGATVGVNINNAGTTGFFTVTGTGTTDGSGGTIQNTTQNGILIQNTDNITLKNMNLPNAANDGGGAGTCSETVFTGCNAAVEFDTVATVDIDNMTITAWEDHGVFGQTVTDLDISNSEITGLGADVDTNEHAIFVRNLLGTTAAGTDSVFDNLTIDDAQDTAILIQNTTATNTGNTASPDQLTVRNSSLTDAGDSGLNAQTTALAANLKIVATGNTITNTVDGITAEARAGDLQASVGGAGALSNTISAGIGGDMVNGIRYFASAANGAASIDATATNNLITLDSAPSVSGLNGVGVSASGSGSGNLGTIRATVDDSMIDSMFSGLLTQTVHGVITTNEGSGTTSQNVISIDANTITLNPPSGTTTAETVGIGVDGGTTGAGTTVRSTNNTIIAEGDASNGASVGIQILPTEFGDPAGTNTRVCVGVTGNDVSTPNNPFAAAFGTTELDVIAAPVSAGSFLDVEAITTGVRTPSQLVTDLEPLNTNTEVGDTTGSVSGIITGVAGCPM